MRTLGLGPHITMKNCFNMLVYLRLEFIIILKKHLNLNLLHLQFFKDHYILY